MVNPSTAKTGFEKTGVVRAGISVLAVLVLVDLVVALAGRRLDQPLDWYSRQAQQKAGQLRELADAGRTVDVVFVGSSIVDRDVDVATFEELTGLSGWNGGLQAAQASVLERWTSEVVLPALDPGLVVIGLSSLELNDNRRRPTIDLYERQRSSRTGLLAELDRRASRYSALIRHRPQLRRPASLAEKLSGGGLAIDEDVIESLLAEEPARIRNDVLTDFAIGGRELQALTRLLSALTADGARIAVVWMPVPDRFVALHPNGKQDFDMAREAARSVAEQVTDDGPGSVTWLDVSDSQPDDSFADLTHLVDGAASDFTGHLVAALADEGLL